MKGGVYRMLTIKLHESFKEDEKPEWLTMDEILEYSKKMIAQEE